MRTIPRKTTAGLTTTEGVILGLLSEQDERSGYDLLKRAEGSVAHMWTPAKSQLYAVLPRLVDAGLARRRTVRQRARPDKQLYRLTPRGREAVRCWLDTSTPKTWDELLLKVFFAKLSSRAALLGHLDAYAERTREQLETYKAIRPSTGIGALTLQYGLEEMPLRLAWLERTKTELGG